MAARIPRNLVLLGFVSLLTDLSTEMAYPLLPLLLTTLGGSGALVGLLEGAGEATASLIKIISGRVSDHLGRRKSLTVLGYAFSAVSKVGYVVATIPAHVLTARVADRFGKGIRSPPRDALIAETVDQRSRGAGFGFHRALDNAGALLAPFAALLILEVLGMPLESVFLLALVPAAAAVFLLLWVREPKPPKRKPQSAAGARPPPVFWSYILTMGVFAISNTGFVFLLLAASQHHARVALFVFIAYNLAYALLSYPLGKASDRFGRATLLGIGMAGAAAAHASASWLVGDQWPLLLVPALLYGFASAATEGNGRALAADLAPASRRATTLGYYHAFLGVAVLPGGLLLGLLWDQHPKLAFAAGAIFASAALMELSWLHFRRQLAAPA